MSRSGTIWWLYVLRCSDFTLYCGITTNVQRRRDEHNGWGRRGAKYTRSRRPVVVMGSWAFSTRKAAAYAERKFKKLSRGEKMRVINYPRAFLDGVQKDLEET